MIGSTCPPQLVPVYVILYTLEQLENEIAYKSQLKSFAMDARFMWQKLKVKKGLCHTGPGLKSLESLLNSRTVLVS